MSHALNAAAPLEGNIYLCWSVPTGQHELILTYALNSVYIYHHNFGHGSAR